jgi:hypothetical protein
MPADTFAKAAVAVLVVLIVSLLARSRWVTDRDEGRDERTLVGLLLGLTAAGVAVVIVAAILGPHPV